MLGLSVSRDRHEQRGAASAFVLCFAGAFGNARAGAPAAVFADALDPIVCADLRAAARLAPSAPTAVPANRVAATLDAVRPAPAMDAYRAAFATCAVDRASCLNSTATSPACNMHHGTCRIFYKIPRKRCNRWHAACNHWGPTDLRRPWMHIEPPLHAWHLLRSFPCAQISLPPQSLHRLFLRPCSQTEMPPHSLHRDFCRPCTHVTLFGAPGSFAADTGGLAFTNVPGTIIDAMWCTPSQPVAAPHSVATLPNPLQRCGHVATSPTALQHRTALQPCPTRCSAAATLQHHPQRCSTARGKRS